MYLRCVSASCQFTPINDLYLLSALIDSNGERLYLPSSLRVSAQPLTCICNLRETMRTVYLLAGVYLPFVYLPLAILSCICAPYRATLLDDFASLAAHCAFHC